MAKSPRSRSNALPVEENRIRFPRLRKLPDPDVRMTVKLLGWQWEYGIGFNLFDDHNKLAEEDALVLQGTVVRPSTKRFAGFDVSLNAYGLARGKDGDHDAFLSMAGVGGLQREQGYFAGGFSMPRDMLPVVLSLLRSEQYPYLTMTLVKGGRSHYDIQSYRFRHSDPAPDDD